MRVLDAADVAALLDWPSCIAAMEAAFGRHGRGEIADPALCGVHVPGGGFHVKAAALDAGRPYFAAKVNANFPSNPGRHGFPTIQGVVVLFDASRGEPLALLDSVEITLRRTAAATAVAAKYLARPDSRTVALYGCGVQGRAHVHALREVLPIERVYACDVDPAAAERIAREFGSMLEVVPAAAEGFAARALSSDVCVTCTTSRDYLLRASDVAAGAFVAGVGVDDPAKRELSPDLIARSRVVVDVLEQCVAIGDLHHAIAGGVLTRDEVHATLGEVVAGRRARRTTEHDVFVFDSTGTALQDVAAAALVFERALESGRGLEIDLRGSRS